MPFPWRTTTCVICGKTFRTQAPRGIYCSPECRAEGKRNLSRLYSEAMKAHHEKRRQQYIETRMASKRQCNGCEWRSWQDHTKCVMPTCMLKALEKYEEEKDGRADI